jgi:hypothetical protein
MSEYTPGPWETNQECLTGQQTIIADEYPEIGQTNISVDIEMIRNTAEVCELVAVECRKDEFLVTLKIDRPISFALKLGDYFYLHHSSTLDRLATKAADK